MNKVTDPILIKELVKQGIDPNFVDFIQDYAPRSKGKEHSPYAKFYEDLVTGTGFMVVSGLPMVNPEGQKLLPVWTTHGQNFKQETNLFDARTYKGELKLTCLCDQPTGIKKFEQAIWNPRLFLNGNEVKPTKDYPSLLEVDPINKNYQYNTLEWDYGVCKRRVRLIEGRLRERWIFHSNPNADVRIKHNFIGKGVKLSGTLDANGMPLQTIIAGDEELVLGIEFVNASYPVQIGASATYYPDADPETSSVDGWVGAQDINSTWNAVHDHAGTHAGDDNDYLLTQLSQNGTGPTYRHLRRSHIVVDVSGLPDVNTVTGVVTSVYGNAKLDGWSISPTVNLFAATPASNTAIVIGDYDGFELGVDTPYCDTDITYAGFNIGTPGTINNFAFNATGIAAVQAASDGNTVVKLGFREATYDAPDNAPTLTSGYVDSYIYPWAADKGAGYKPKLVVTYTPVSVPRHGFVNFQDPGIV